ncbi:MAG: L17 family ribosomal protein [bacterium]
MRKMVKKQKLNVKTSHSGLMLRNLFESLLTYGKVETTQSKAKILRSYTDVKLNSILNSKADKVDNSIVKKLGSVREAEKVMKFVLFLRKQGKETNSGFTTMVRTKYRVGDNSLMIEVRLFGFDDFLKAQKPLKKATTKVKKEEKKIVKSAKGGSAYGRKAQKKDRTVVPKKESKAPEIKEHEKEEGFFTKLGERFLGRKSAGPVIERKGRASSRSGI